MIDTAAVRLSTEIFPKKIIRNERRENETAGASVPNEYPGKKLHRPN